MLSVMPKPPAAFSPLITTRSSFHFLIRFGSRSRTTVRPLRPTTSPMKRIRMPPTSDERTRDTARTSDAFARPKAVLFRALCHEQSRRVDDKQLRHHTHVD